MNREYRRRMAPLLKSLTPKAVATKIRAENLVRIRSILRPEQFEEFITLLEGDSQTWDRVFQVTLVPGVDWYRVHISCLDGFLRVETTRPAQEGDE